MIYIVNLLFERKIKYYCKTKKTSESEQHADWAELVTPRMTAGCCGTRTRDPRLEGRDYIPLDLDASTLRQHQITNIDEVVQNSLLCRSMQQ